MTLKQIEKFNKKQKAELKEILFTKHNKLRADYYNLSWKIKDLLKGEQVHYYDAGKSGRYGWVSDDESKYVNLLNALKIDINWGNDAPRGGKKGQFLYIKKQPFTFEELVELVATF